MSDHLSADYKIQRAHEHLKLLQKELRASLGSPDAYEIVDETEDKEVTDEKRRVILRRSVIFTREIPILRLGVLVGDVISNVRSALDHVIYTISLSREPDEFKRDRTTEFPIWDNEEAFKRPHRRGWQSLHEIRGIPPEAQAIVEALQPYHGRKLMYEPLWILREMSNIDKHRSIHLAAFSGAEIGLDLSNIDRSVTLHSHQVRPPGIIESGAVLAEIELSLPNVDFTQTAMEMNRKFFFTVAFDYDTPMPDIWVMEGLSDLIDFAEGVVGALDRFVVRT